MIFEGLKGVALRNSAVFKMLSRAKIQKKHFSAKREKAVLTTVENSDYTKNVVDKVGGKFYIIP